MHTNYDLLRINIFEHIELQISKHYIIIIFVLKCLRPVYLCDGMAITTTEGLGSKQAGFHEIQQRLADNNGSQCGFCTVGMVMSMYR